LRPEDRDRLWRTVRAARLVVVGHAAGEPRTLLRALAEVAPPGLRILTGFGFEGSPVSLLADETGLVIDTWHPTRITRPLILSGRIGYLPLRSGMVPAVFRSLRPDVALLAMSPSQADGRMSFGASAGHSATAARYARQLVVEINPDMPATRGERGIRVERAALSTEAEESPPAYRPTEPDDTARAVALRVIDILADGVRIQLGIGAVPEALATMLASRAGPRRISFFGMGMDAMAMAAENGVVDESVPWLVSPELVGPRIWRLAGIDRRVLVSGAERSYSARHLACTGRLISVNSALAVDLSGQVALERVNGDLVSGLGGAFDFALAANLSPNGLSLIALESTARQGTVSRIVRDLGAGTAVAIPAHVPDYVITEFGAARIRGLTVAQRREAIASLAHPAFRADLLGTGFPARG